MTAQTKAEVSPPLSNVWDRVPVWAFLLVLCLIGGVLRYLMATRSGIWRDEAQFIYISRLPSVGEMVTFLREHESHPPLFYLIARLWQGVVGQSEIAILLLPVVLGVLQIPSIYYVGTRMYDRKTGLMAASLVMLSPELLYFASEVRPYSFLPLIALFSTYFLWQRLQTHPHTLAAGMKMWLPYSLTVAVGLYSHNWFFFVFLVQTLFLAGYLLVMTKSKPNREALTLLGYLTAGPVLAFLLYLPWLPSFLHQIGHAGHTEGDISLQIMLFHLPIGSTIGALEAKHSLVIGFVALIPAVIGGILSYQAKEKTTCLSPFPLLVALPILVYALLIPVNTASTVLLDRCLVTLAPLIFLAVASGYVTLGKQQRWLPLVTLILVWAAYTYALVTLFPNAKSNARDAAALLTRVSQPSDVLVIAPEWMAADINFYYKGDLEQYCYPNPGRSTLAPFNDIRQRYGTPESLQQFKASMETWRQENRRVWLLLSVDHLKQLLEMKPLPDDANMAADDRFTPGATVTIRTIQIAHSLASRYGPPLKKYDDELPRRGRYDYALLLFDPNPQAGQP